MFSEWGGGLVLLAAAAGAAFYFGEWPVSLTYTYRAEVGYYEKGHEVWYVGGDTTYDACVSEATGRFIAINTERPKRAFSWACRKMQGERFLERVR